MSFVATSRYSVRRVIFTANRRFHLRVIVGLLYPYNVHYLKLPAERICPVDGGHKKIAQRPKPGAALTRTGKKCPSKVTPKNARDETSIYVPCCTSSGAGADPVRCPQLCTCAGTIPRVFSRVPCSTRVGRLGTLCSLQEQRKAGSGQTHVFVPGESRRSPVCRKE